MANAGRLVSALDSAITVSEKQARILALLSRGLTTKEIAGQVGISSNTVAEHIHNLERRLSARTLAQLTILASAHGFLATTLNVAPVTSTRNGACGLKDENGGFPLRKPSA